MPHERTYRVVRLVTAGGTRTVARGITTMAEAAEIALRLAKLQEQELGGDDDFYAEEE